MMNASRCSYGAVQLLSCVLALLSSARGTFHRKWQYTTTAPSTVSPARVDLKTTTLSVIQTLDDVSLRIVTIENPPFIFSSPNGGYEGYLIQMLDELEERLQFSYELYTVHDNKFGKQDPLTGQWSGMMGDLIAGRADMILAPLTVTFKRERVIDFTLPFMTTNLRMLLKRPPPGGRIPFGNLIDLVGTQRGLEFGVLREGSTFEFFHYNSFRLFRKVAQIFQNEPERLVSTMATGIERVRKENYTFIGEEMLMRYWVQQQPCDLLIVGEPVTTFDYALAFPVNRTDIIAAFNYKILEMKEDGTLHRLEAQWWQNQCVKPQLCICENKATPRKKVAAAYTLNDYHDQGTDNNNNNKVKW